ncbi:MAG: hypothetical protein U0942_16090 [Parvibaculum sp.]|jgi:hypothetical protein|uniref:hypothetical protein n=1 Tax=Parvibaculum sp. TaxID=2024848 RepID=UPI002ABA64C2|nr:hypothetical protein [Parvibaculum sp.]MDZ4382852.1 hypothetical protein [Parvibaculum sp.]
MQKHKYDIGETVEFTAGGSYPPTARGHYTVVRQLPSEGDGYQYRIKSLSDGHERMVREGQLG